MDVISFISQVGEIYAYEWSINTYINWETQSDTGRRYLGLAIDADVLQGSSQYEVSVRGICFPPPFSFIFEVWISSRSIIRTFSGRAFHTNDTNFLEFKLV